MITRCKKKEANTRDGNGLEHNIIEASRISES